MRALAAVCCLVVACKVNPVDEPAAGVPNPRPLAFGLSSYATLAEGRARFGPNAAWSVDERRKAAQGSCPRFDETNASVKRVADLGEVGDLRLAFINGRLYSILFYPDHFDAYLTKLEANGTRFDKDGFTSTGLGARAWTAASTIRPRFVAWSDQNIESEIHWFIRTCS